MILEDFVMLGTTVPEPNSDDRVFVCSAGVSAEYRKLIRIYPLSRINIPHRWGKYRVRVERNPKDHREESFKIAGDRSPGAHERINKEFEVVTDKIKPQEKPELLSKFVIGSIKEANAKRMSLAIIHPESFELHYDTNPEAADAPQMSLFDLGQAQPTAGARRFPFMPRLRFHDECGWNNLMLRDWGCFERMRKAPDRIAAPDGRKYMTDALHLDADSSLLIGNMNNQRNAWLIISVLNGIREAPTLFDALPNERLPISDKLRREVYARDEWKCRVCGDPADLTIDHIWPHAKGGTNALDNLQTLCRPCNSAKGDATIQGVA